MKYHPLSAYFPMLPEDEFMALVDSIDRFGQLEAITLLDGKILDGRNRYEACMELQVDPMYRAYNSNQAKPLEFVVAANMRRRHLTSGQKAQIIIQIDGRPEPMSPEDSADLSHGRGAPHPPSYTNLAEKAGVHRSTIRAVAEVQEDDVLVSELYEGTITANEAQREYRARQGMQPSVTKTQQTKYEGLDEVKWILEYITSWTRKIDDFIEAIKEDKFSPEAKQFTVRKVRKLSEKLLALLEELDE